MEKNKYFKSLDYHDKRQAKASLAEYLATQEGWQVFGYHPDTSDSMTDYFNPASWDGIATYKDYVLVVDAYGNRDSGKEIIKTTHHTKPCEHCLESGEEPSGWMYDDAKEDPAQFWNGRMRNGKPIGIISAGANFVPRDFFNDNGTEKCQECKGKGEVHSHTTSEKIGQWPTFQQNPKAKQWHLEKNGSIIISGQSVAKMYRGYWEGHSGEQTEQVAIECKAFVDALYIAMVTKQPSDGGVYSHGDTVKTGKFEIIDYSPKAIALCGDTKPFKDKLGRASGGLGGMFNAHLKHPTTGDKFVGWIFSKNKRNEVEEFVRLHS